ncbi:hypothetical protein A2671_01155 [Candidatus Kaiserbacteria bacterium RIFCSPHIGHO2_01_FULL_49_13]|uniref:Uncharacterized protein n=1 Tax=Candidatus Kaiserbacteria bacterium RIFCSPHIGHO2_01_FULL_49_13 TaxID=1798477 RepID=A0A1F6CE22_9BACT|nr:MAG: hypothetical protein A2671_01155 [Candidatus Kaiserbacteria bacterium RIFCSPHIGHO2_01_FULL_49_13]
MHTRSYSLTGTIGVVLAVVLSVFFVVMAVDAATTISTDISTGGTLDVTGATTLSSTLAVTGHSTLTTASTTAASVSATGIGAFAVASTTPDETVSIGGDVSIGSSATTTVFVDSTAATTGGCFQMRGSNGILYRAYLVATTTASEGVVASWQIEAGMCQ